MVLMVLLMVRRRREEEEAEEAAAGCSKKNKNPTWQCGEIPMRNYPRKPLHANRGLIPNKYLKVIQTKAQIVGTFTHPCSLFQHKPIR